MLTALKKTQGLHGMDYLKALESGARSILGVALACGTAGIIAGMLAGFVVCVGYGLAGKRDRGSDVELDGDGRPVIRRQLRVYGLDVFFVAGGQGRQGRREGEEEKMFVFHGVNN